MLVKQNMKRAYYSALGLLGSHDAAMEASQEAFIRAYRYFSGFDRSKKFFTWYYRILKNLCLNMIRDAKSSRRTDFIENIEEDSSSVNPYENLEQTELCGLVQEALMELDADDREVIILKEFQNLSYKEIADILEIPIGSVMSKLFYARKKLAVKLKSKM